MGIRDQPRAAKVAFVVSTLRSLRYATTGIPLANDGTVQLQSLQAKPLASWATSKQPLFSLFRTLAEQALPAINEAQPKHTKNPKTFSTVKALVKEVNLTGLASKIYKQESTRRMDHLQLTAPPELSVAMPSILSTTTSLPFNYFCRSVKHNRLNDDVFTALYQRKLRLPLTLRSRNTTHCPHCKSPMDPFGDHFFNCSYNKTTLHNSIRDTLCNVIKPLGKLAQWTTCDHDTDTELPALLNAPFDKHRPADIGMSVLRAATNPPQDPPIKTVAIDVTMTPSPSHPSLPPATETKTLTKVHQEAMRLKLNGKHKIDNDSYFADMNRQGILLLPFTVDPFGGFGFHGHKLLYGGSNSPPERPTTAFVNSLSELATANYKRLHSQPRNLLKLANQNTPAPKSQVLARMRPSRWAHQALALNVSTHLAKHLLKSINQHSRKSPVPKPPKTKFLGNPLSTPVQTPFLDPLPVHLQLRPPA